MVLREGGNPQPLRAAQSWNLDRPTHGSKCSGNGSSHSLHSRDRNRERRGVEATRKRRPSFRKESFDALAAATTANALRLFRIAHEGT